MQQVGDASDGILATINLISGGAFGRLSIFALTIGPYITASIVLNLLQVIIPSLEKLAREGEEGLAKRKEAEAAAAAELAEANVEAASEPVSEVASEQAEVKEVVKAAKKTAPKTKTESEEQE